MQLHKKDWTKTGESFLTNSKPTGRVFLYRGKIRARFVVRFAMGGMGCNI